jgi:hypothetical protein
MSMGVSSAAMMVAVRPFAGSLQVKIIGIFEMAVDMMMFRMEAIECV